MIIDCTGNVAFTEQKNDYTDEVIENFADAHEIWKEWTEAKFGKMKYPDLARASRILEDALLDARMRKVLKMCIGESIRVEVEDIIDQYERIGMTVMYAAKRIATLDRELYEKRKAREEEAEDHD